MSNPTSSDTDPTTLIATSVVAPAQKCYMVVTPSVLNSNGTRDLDGNDIKWFVKFGDGEGEPQSGRYVTHNPDYEIQTNNKGRAGTELKREVFERRGFKTSVGHGRTKSELESLPSTEP
ncbi:hypothetical protein FOMPIDRAFT_1054231 [Fomitopsis schrenkii]|uniref:Uncharacterized protein n=1 Tax=Fomitopsis schrenkii TaxID=2126942 RepID=S8DVX0_FOMSC|nr:hypothetical protein FOMPIDRAFT_1054231 [Fomitopsis schrenkii]